jgi:hypothetical protein
MEKINFQVMYIEYLKLFSLIDEEDENGFDLPHYLEVCLGLSECDLYFAEKSLRKQDLKVAVEHFHKVR